MGLTACYPVFYLVLSLTFDILFLAGAFPFRFHEQQSYKSSVMLDSKIFPTDCTVYIEYKGQKCLLSFKVCNKHTGVI